MIIFEAYLSFYKQFFALIFYLDDIVGKRIYTIGIKISHPNNYEVKKIAERDNIIMILVEKFNPETNNY